MTVNFAGVAGGSTLVDAMGAKAAYGSWIAASYALVILCLSDR
jgi:hypothetical protein